MQYADGGNLRNYLNNHFSDLNWKDHKIKLAYQITEGIKYLSKNIVMHQNNRSWYCKMYRNRNTSSFGFI